MALRRMTAWVLALALLMGLTAGCGVRKAADGTPRRVAALSGSLAELWLLAGGTLAGVTEDAAELPGLSPETVLLGSLKNPSAEAILALSPDLVLLSPALAQHRKLETLLTDSGIPVFAAEPLSPEAYLEALGELCRRTGCPENYEKYGLRVTEQVDELLGRIPADSPPPSALALRLYATGGKAKATGTVLCTVLEDAGVRNVAAGGGVLEELSVEAVAAADPDWIFAVVMGGDTQAALSHWQDTVGSTAVWQSLRAVREGRFVVLPADLFHEKPNARWPEAYQYLLALLWPEEFA